MRWECLFGHVVEWARHAWKKVAFTLESLRAISFHMIINEGKRERERDTFYFVLIYNVVLGCYKVTIKYRKLGEIFCDFMDAWSNGQDTLRNSSY